MSKDKIVKKSFLLIFAFFATFVLTVVISLSESIRPPHTLSFQFVLFAASIWPLWQDGRILGRIFLFFLSAIVGLSVWAGIGWLANYLLDSGTVDAWGAAQVAGMKWLGAVPAFLLNHPSSRIRTLLTSGASETLAKVQAGTTSKISSFKGFNPADYDDAIFSKVWDELESNAPDKATWAKAIVISGGDEAKARASYIEIRVKALSSKRI
jgi:hypothetical protein